MSAGTIEGNSQGAPVVGAVVFLESAAAGAVTAAGSGILSALQGQK